MSQTQTIDFISLKNLQGKALNFTEDMISGCIITDFDPRRKATVCYYIQKNVDARLFGNGEEQSSCMQDNDNILWHT